MKTEGKTEPHNAEAPQWYNAMAHAGNAGNREMRIVGEFVDIEEDGNVMATTPLSFPKEHTVGNDEILFAKFLIAAMFFVSEPKMKSANYAELLGVSRTCFFSHLKNASAECPFDILTKLRICISKALLARTGKKVNEIAIDVGKENTGYFSSFFKRHTGMTPLEFRSKYQSDGFRNGDDELGVMCIPMADGRVWNVHVDRFAERMSLRKGTYLELIRGL